MKRLSLPPQLSTNQYFIFGSLMLVTFLTETLVMFLLPYLFPHTQQVVVNFADAGLLSVLIAPIVWGLIAEPLRSLATAESARTKAVLESIVDAVVSFDENGVIESVNPAAERAFGYPPHEIVGEGIHRIIPVLSSDSALLHSYPASVDPQQSWRIPSETVARHRNGSIFPIESSVGVLDTHGRRSFIAIMHDITNRKRVAAMVEQQREFLESLVQQCAVPMFVLSPEHRVLIWNRACEKLTGIRAEEMLESDEAWRAFYGRKRPVLADFLISGELEQAHQRYGSFCKSSFIPEGVQAEGWYPDLNGKERYIVFNAAPIRSGSGELLAAIQTLEDITDRKRYEEQLEYQANHDSLTGLPNLNLLSDRIRQALLISRRSKQEVAVFLLDLDNFKLINDTLGHDGGDQLLNLVAQRLNGVIRAGDTVARHGGDEFIIIVSEQAVSDNASLIAGKILEAVAQPLALDGHEVVVTASIGISIYPRDGEDSQSLVKNAEVAMYRAKEQGRNCFQFYTGEMNARSLARMTLENQLRRALERDELTLYYQPKVNLGSGQITGMEALLRWQNPELGMVTPDAFIPLAEETGLVVPIGTWVLREACAQTKAWQDAGLPSLTVAVNLSPRQFRQQDIASVVEQCLRETGLEPRFLELEITESMVMQDAERVTAVLNELKRMGVSLAMDDFGTGYSSLGYLKRFPFDKLKIDKSFVKDITFEPNNAAIAKTVIAMAHGLHMKVIAEGVETQGQLNYLRLHGCDEMQGYFFSRPIPAERFERLLRDPVPLPVAARTETAPQKTVLVVDDDEGVTSSLERLLLMDGYAVLRASNALEGFELLALNRVAVILSDFRMPGMNGAEFLGRAKELYPDTVRIMLSGHADFDSVTDAVNRGAIYKFLNKPWNDDDVREKVGQAFRQYALRRAA